MCEALIERLTKVAQKSLSLHEPITVGPYCVKMSTELVELQYVLL